MNFFKSNNKHALNKQPIDWNSLNSASQLDFILKASIQSPIILFKHSTRCIISKMALKNLESQALTSSTNQIDTAKFYIIDVIKHREVSNLITEKLKIVHQSPQVLLIKNQQVTYHSSHENIHWNNISNSINKP